MTTFTQYFRSLVLGCGLIAGLAGAYPWNSEPQPLLENQDAIMSDPGSPLAWDQTARVLWFTSGGYLQSAKWDGKGFHQQPPITSVKPFGGLVIDSALHKLFTLNDQGMLCCLDARRALAQIGNEPLHTVLGVDRDWHFVFAYDAVARGIRQYRQDAKTKQWSSTLIVTGLGEPGDQAAFDDDLHAFYSTFETADTGIPRHSHVTPMGDPTGLGAWKPWPLVAVRWNGKTWSAQVIDETGVPQLPAVKARYHSVYFARRDDLNAVRFYQPKAGNTPESFGVENGWDGVPTFEDNASYAIKKPQYPAQWLNSVGSFDLGSITTTWDLSRFFTSSNTPLQAPITVVPYYEPVWTDTLLPNRVTYFSAQFNQRQGRLNLHRQIASGEVVRRQTGSRLAGYLYKDANGVLATHGTSLKKVKGMSIWTFTEGTSTPPVVDYPVLDATFDPEHPPASIVALNSPTAVFYSDFECTSTMPTPVGPLAPANVLRAWCSVNADAPFVPAQMRLPTAITASTFGHLYLSKAKNQPGARFRTYNSYETGLAVPSSLALDFGTGFTFYTQLPDNTSLEASFYPSWPGNFAFGSTVWGKLSVPHSVSPLSGFMPAPDPKLPAPQFRSGWIDVVY